MLFFSVLDSFNQILFNNKMYFAVNFHAYLYVNCPGEANGTHSAEWLLNLAFVIDV